MGKYCLTENSKRTDNQYGTPCCELEFIFRPAFR